MTSPTKSVAAPRRVVVVGLGRHGQHRAEQLRLLSDWQVAGLCDLDSEALVRCATLGEPRDWTSVLRDQHVDVVWLATPIETRVELATAALEANKHVVVEPPLAASVAEFDKVLKLAESCGRSLTVAHSRRFDPDFQTPLRLVRQGELGTLELLTLTLWQQHPAPLQGTTLWNFAPDFCDQLLLLADSRPTGMTAYPLKHTGLGADYGLLAIIQFGSGAIARLELHRSALPPVDSGWMLTGTRGGYARGTQYFVTAQQEIEDVPLPPETGSQDSFYAVLASHLRHGTPSPVTTSEARQVVSLLEALQEAG